MKTKFFFGAVSLLTVIGCGSEPVKTQAYVAPDPGAVSQTEFVPKAGDVLGAEANRAPAQSNGTTLWHTDSKTISVGPAGGSVNVVLNPRQSMFFERSYQYTCDMLAWASTDCTDYVCTGGAGKSDLWNDYYAARKEGKAAALDAALKGIGQQTAIKLNASGVFEKKPRSWQDFRERMNLALKGNFITADQYREVFATYGQENRSNLGYAGESCRPQVYRCDAYGLVSVVNGCTGKKIEEKVINTLTKNIQVNIRNPQLQRFETESINVTAGQDYNSVMVQRSDKTAYKVEKRAEGDNIVITMDGQDRLQIPLPASVLQKISFSDTTGRPLTAVIEVDPNYIGQQGSDRMVVMLQVTHCTPGGFFTAGDCKGTDKVAKKILAAGYFAISQASTALALPVVPSGDRVWVTYAISRENSKWYTNTPTAVNTQRLSDLKK